MSRSGGACFRREGGGGKIIRLHASLDHEAEVQVGQEVELERQRGESRERENLLTQLSEAQGLRVTKGLQVAGGELRVAAKICQAA